MTALSEKGLSIIVPALNEAGTLEKVIEQITGIRFPVDYEVIIVDDGSSDSTYAVACRLKDQLKKAQIQVIRHNHTCGRGSCVRNALGQARGKWLIVQDADLEYSPADMLKLLEPALSGQSEVVYGSRFLGSKWPKGMALANYLANRHLVFLANSLYRLSLTDVMGCYKLMSCAMLKGLKLSADGFELDAELTARIAQKGIPILEVPISYKARTRQQGKKIRPRDFWQSRETFLHLRTT